MSHVFLDTANLDEIKEMMQWNIVKGVTTNQKIFLKEKGCKFEERAKQILDLVYPLPVSIEGPNNLDDLVYTALKYVDWVDDNDQTFNNIVIKVPMLGNGDGLKAVKQLSNQGIFTNVTACMTLNQAFLAASAGATYVSLFYNRMIDWALSQKEEKNVPEMIDGRMYALSTISSTMNTFETSGFRTQLIVGSIRNPIDVEEILTVAPDIITIPTPILKQMVFNEKTEETLKEFDNAWKEFCKHEK